MGENFKYRGINKKTLILFLSLLVIVQAKAQQIESGKDQYRKIGPVYFVDADDKHAMLSIFTLQTADKYSCILRLYDLQTAKISQQKEIISSSAVTSENIIGRMQNVLWLFTDSLCGYDVQTLGLVATETDIATRNSFMKDNFTKYANGYLLDEAANVLYITAADDERYKLCPDLQMKPDDNISDPAIDENFSYEYAAEYKVNDRYQLKYALTNIDTLNQHLYILGSEKETSQVLSYYGSSIYADNEEMRKLTVIPYNMNGENVDYKNQKPITSTQQYFKAGFLQKKFFPTAWHGNNGERLICYEKNKKLSVALTDKNGNEKWNVDCNGFFNNFTDYLVNDKYLIVWFVGKNGDEFICIDISNGNTVLS